MQQRFDRLVLHRTAPNRIEIRDIELSHSESAVVRYQGNRIAVAESNVAVRIAVASNGVNGTSIDKIDDADDSRGNRRFERADQSASLRDGSEKSDSTFTMA